MAGVMLSNIIKWGAQWGCNWILNNVGGGKGGADDTRFFIRNGENFTKVDVVLHIVYPFSKPSKFLCFPFF